MFVALGLVLSQTNWITVPVLLHFLNRYLSESKIMQATDLQSVRQVISTATGLPNAHYIDPRIYEEEKKSYCSISGLGWPLHRTFIILVT